MTDTLRHDTALTAGALAVVHTGTSDAAWDGPANEKNLSNDDGEAVYKKAYAWQDSDADPDKKNAYAFIHHFVSPAGDVGDASTKACSSTMAILNGGRGVDVKGADWYGDRKGISAHVIAHLKDAGVKDEDLPELDDMSVVETRLAAHREQELAAMESDLAIQPEPLAAVHKPFTGRHTHAHSTFAKQASTGDPAIEQTHTHAHSHNKSSSHDHAHGAAADHEHPFAGMNEAERRKADPDNEITDPERLSAMVASALADYGVEPITAATKPDGTIVGSPWHCYACCEGIRTDDGRELMVGSTHYPDMPISIRLIVEDDGGHWGAVTCGRCDTAAPVVAQGLNFTYCEGVFGSDPNGQLAELMVTEQTQRFISIDPRDVEGQVISVVISTGDGDWDDDFYEDSWLQITSFTLGALTIVPMPALQMCCITLKSVPLPDSPIAIENAPPSLPNPALLIGITAAGGPMKPRKEWFDDPGFHDGDPRLVLQADGRSYACPWTITTEGQCFGHVAWWECDHTGFQGRKVKPPRSKSGYAYYLVGPGVECEDGTVIEGVGQVSAGCGHASTSLGWQATQAFYDGGYGAWQVADLRAGQDAYGPWVAGALRPNLTEQQVREARALSLSGDWREIGGNLELVAVLAVPVPGFPIRRALAASGSSDLIDFCAVREGIRGERVVSLVAAGRVVAVPPEQRIERLEREMLNLREHIHTMTVEREMAALAS